MKKFFVSVACLFMLFFVFVGTNLEAAVYTSSSSFHRIYYRDQSSGDSRRATTTVWFHSDYAYAQVNSGNYTVSKWSSYNGTAEAVGGWVSPSTFSSHWHYYE